MIFCGARDKWGYARARPPYKLLKDDASWLAYRFIYKYLFMPAGIPKKTSEGKDLDIHHTCGRGRQGCIQPAHLTPLDADTNKELGDMDYAIC